MENKTVGIGALIVVFVAIIVGIVLLQGAANNVAGSTTTSSLSNYTITLGANGVPKAITGFQEIDSTYTIFNGTGSVSHGNVSVASASNGGAKQLYVTVNQAAYAGVVVNITAATVQPVGYIDDGASRSIAGLIIIFGALAIAVVALYPVVKEHLGY